MEKQIAVVVNGHPRQVHRQPLVALPTASVTPTAVTYPPTCVIDAATLTALNHSPINRGGGGLHRVEFLCHNFCAKFLYAICLVFLRICTYMIWLIVIGFPWKSQKC